MRPAPLLTLLLLLAACGDDAGEERVRLATTTSTENSGLLAAILPAFTEATGVRVDVLAMGSGKALATARNGDCDLVLAHAPELEMAFVAEGHGVRRTPVMGNDFVLLGMAEDPARVHGGRDAPAALKAIAAGGHVFCSRGDASGTHEKERALWAAAGVEPAGAWYRSAGQGMGETLRMAWEMKAYVLADRGTWLKMKEQFPGMEILVEGDARLDNPYHLILVNPERHKSVHAEAARRLLEWLVGPEGQRRIGEYRVGGGVLFRPVPAGG